MRWGLCVESSCLPLTWCCASLGNAAGDGVIHVLYAMHLGRWAQDADDTVVHALARELWELEAVSFPSSYY